MRAASLAPTSLGDTWFAASAGFSASNHTWIVDCMVRGYTDVNHILSYTYIGSDHYHLRGDSSGRVRLGRSTAPAFNIWPDSYTGRALIEQTWDLYLDAYPCVGQCIKIPLPPLIAIDGIFGTGL